MRLSLSRSKLSPIPPRYSHQLANGVENAKAGSPDEKEWTFLFYNAGQRDISNIGTHLVNDLERVGSDENTHVAVLNYREGSMLRKSGGYDGARSYYITRHDKASTRGLVGSRLGSLLDAALSKPGQIRSAEFRESRKPGESFRSNQESVLKDFLLESMEKYPAKHYALVVTGHGAAFQGQAVMRGPEGRSALSNDALGTVLGNVAKESGRRIDLVNLNTCYSANLETLYSLKESTSVLVGSESPLSIRTQPFAAVLAEVQERLRDDVPIDPHSLGEIFVDQAREQPLAEIYSPTLSSFDSSKLGRLGSSVSALQRACMENGISPAVLRECLDQSLGFEFSSKPREVRLTDVGSLADVIAAKVANSAVKAAANKVKKELLHARISEQHSEAEKQSPLSRLLRKLPLINDEVKDLSGASGLTLFWDPKETERLSTIENSRYGREHPIREFMAYLSGDG